MTWSHLSLSAGLLGVFITVASGAPTNHWAFQPIGDPQPPRVTRTSWCRTPVDAFLLAKLEEAGRVPSPQAGPHTLIRRITFDLTGLPPNPAEVESFVQSARRDQPSAVKALVERLLDSPHYGERWGRWWLDVARYADSNGQDENKVMGNAWRYRDWVIRAFNNNKPFDQFIVEQLAGDLLSPAANERENFDRLTATGFLVLGPKMLAEQDKPKLVMDIVDEQIDTVGRAFLGLTLGCARCHDHKFDPVPTRDYYAMAGIFKSTRTMENLDFVSKFNERRVATKEELAAIAAHDQRMADVTNRINAAVRAANETLIAGWQKDFPRYLAAAARSPITLPSADLDTNVLQRFQALLAREPSTNAVSRTLHEVARATGRAADFIEELKPPTGTAAGLRLAPGKTGAGFEATGENHIDLAHAPELDPPQLTVEAWVRADSFPQKGDTRRWLVNKNSNEWVEGHFGLLVDRGQAGAYLNIGGRKEDVFAVWSGARTLTTKEWHHLAFTYDGSDLRLFVDGQTSGELSVKRTRIPGTSALTLGRRQDGHVNFKGSLDEIHVFNRALTSAEIKARFEQPEQAVRDGIVARWEFNDLSEDDRRQLALGEVRGALLGSDGVFALPKEPRPFYPAATREALAVLEKERDTLKDGAPPGAASAMAVAEDKPVELPVHLRGSHLNPTKDPVPRGFIQAINRPGSHPEIPREHSGRLELARWLTDPENPLTARVIVNRVWQAHFGEGLVRTPDNFGLRGESPSHPELLDWLAREFIRSGWDVKAMHRQILNSAVYQQSSVLRNTMVKDRAIPTKFSRASSSSSSHPSDGGEGVMASPLRQVAASGNSAVGSDPDNRLLSRFPRQRLEAEMIRDGMLDISGRLDPAMGGSLVTWKNNDYVPGDEVSAKSIRRTVYLPIVRDRVFDALTIFDFANPSVCSAKRTPTVVSHQALFFMNSPIVKDSSKALATSLLARTDLDDAARIREAHTRILNRPATKAEVHRALRFLNELTRENSDVGQSSLLAGSRGIPAPSPAGQAENGRQDAARTGRLEARLTPESRLDDFAALCQTLFASNEFVYRH